MSATLPMELIAPVREGLAAVEMRLHKSVVSQHAAMTAATEHLLNAGGKRIRPAICLLVAGLVGADPERSVVLAAAIEMMHTATLVHDDLIDEALLRRNIPTLNADWRTDAVVLAGDYLFARAAGLIARTNNTHVVELFAKTLMVVVNGEIGQRFTSRSRIDRCDYYGRIYAKTAAMFVLSTEAAAVLGEADPASLEALREFGRQVGMAFQIVDDALDFVGTPEQIGKPVGSDLRQGLFTLPAIYYAETHPGDPDVEALFNGSAQDTGALQRVMTAVRASGAVGDALQEARALGARAQLALERLPPSPYLAALSELPRYIVDRDL